MRESWALEEMAGADNCCLYGSLVGEKAEHCQQFELLALEVSGRRQWMLLPLLHSHASLPKAVLALHVLHTMLLLAWICPF